MKVFVSPLVCHLTLFPTSPLFGVSPSPRTPSTPFPIVTTPSRRSNTRLFMGDIFSSNGDDATPRPTSPTDQNNSNSNSASADSSNTNMNSVPLSQLLPPLKANSRRIYLIRHGETDWNKEGKIQGGGYDIPLNANGQSQAKAVAKALQEIPLTVILSSTLSRAKETADILWQEHPNCQRELDGGLKEMGFGEFEGLAIHSPELPEETKARFKTIGRQVNGNPEMRFPGGGESSNMVQERACKAIDTVLQKYPSATDHPHIAVVSHGRTNKVLIASIVYGDVQKFPTIKQKNTAINVLDVDEDGNWDIRVLDYIDHVKDNVIIR
ncbi:unnamed protein product [Cylindrotheca closterium]|uniref:Phosphoglycerate mutase (2,3-diphosphoglycerate-dependent) n=1 Tax=Cylindrotheca closterium TaxID=2856 RepID=A0AAD2CRQ2_9STRA|nr:unnamed protein product [Cylindrotheca closterium]